VKHLGITTVSSGLFFLALGLLGPGSSARAQNFCEHGGKRYTIHATRCTNGEQLRCVAHQTWKSIGKCAPPAAPSGPQFCEHGGKRYTIHATRCTNGDHLRCVAHNTWKSIGQCKR
jgi:hypothetical protein